MQLTDFHANLIAQNGDPRKPEIAHAQKYFAIQARRQELSDQAAADIQVLSRCEWGHDDYSLQVENLPKAPPASGQQALFDEGGA